jgi:GTP-binding protein YchF
MGFNCGIVGLPNVGKSTLFNAITAGGAEVSNYPFCTIDPNVGVVTVPDPRLDVLARMYRPRKVVPTAIEFVDIAGLVRGASKGEGLGNQFLAHIRDVDAIAHVVRCFEDPNVTHVDGRVDPVRDIEVVEAELILKDLETVERRMGEAEKKAKSGDRRLKAETAFYDRVKQHLSGGRLARYCQVATGEETVLMREMHLLSNKPVMYVCNIHERDLGKENPHVSAVRAIAEKEGARVVSVSASVEADIAELAADERTSFLESLGLKESGLDRVTRESYALLRLLTFFTANEKEVRAWTIPRGTYAAEAAGVIHSDFERGFIRAEVIKYVDIARMGSEHAVKENGLLHIEGREYRVEDGDVLYVRFNV